MDSQAETSVVPEAIDNSINATFETRMASVDDAIRATVTANEGLEAAQIVVNDAVKATTDLLRQLVMAADRNPNAVVYVAGLFARRDISFEIFSDLLDGDRMFRSDVALAVLNEPKFVATASHDEIRELAATACGASSHDRDFVARAQQVMAALTTADFSVRCEVAVSLQTQCQGHRFGDWTGFTLRELMEYVASDHVGAQDRSASAWVTNEIAREVAQYDPAVIAHEFEVTYARLGWPLHPDHDSSEFRRVSKLHDAVFGAMKTTEQLALVEQLLEIDSAAAVPSFQSRGVIPVRRVLEPIQALCGRHLKDILVATVNAEVDWATAFPKADESRIGDSPNAYRAVRNEIEVRLESLDRPHRLEVLAGLLKNLSRKHDSALRPVWRAVLHDRRQASDFHGEFIFEIEYFVASKLTPAERARFERIREAERVDARRRGAWSAN